MDTATLKVACQVAWMLRAFPQEESSACAVWSITGASGWIRCVASRDPIQQSDQAIGQFLAHPFQIA
ncbi:MAG: hypothetical protein CMJ67_01900 [Planctomycetaceae bacterium]|nr:hypothetical protein [Planctomycetaceae bacterium]